MEMDSLVGFRFKPTNEEIICLLNLKRLDPDFSVQTVKEIDFYRFDPWELPWYSGIQSKESIWYFYCKPYNFKNSKSSKHRKTKSGSWKITGKGSTIKAKNTKVVIGSKKILSFYLRGHVSKEAKTEWIMHEIHVKDDPLYKEDVVVCRLERRRDNKPSLSTSDDNESSHLVVLEDTSPKSVPPPNQQVVYDRNHVAEKTSLLLSDNLQGESMLFAQFDAFQGSNGLNYYSLPALQSPIDVEEDGFSGCNGLDHNPVSAQPYPINPEQPTSSYFDGLSALDFHFDNQQEDLILQCALQDTFPLEETERILSPCFNSSEGESSFTNTETFNACVNGYFPKDSGYYYFDSIWNHN